MGKKHLKEFHKHELLDCFNNSYVFSINESISLDETCKAVDALAISDDTAKSETGDSGIDLKSEATPPNTCETTPESKTKTRKERAGSHSREATPVSDSYLSQARGVTPVSESRQSPASICVNGRELPNSDIVYSDESVRHVKQALASKQTSVLVSCDGNDAEFSRESSDSGMASDCDSLRVLQRIESKIDVVLDGMADFAKRLSVVERKVDGLERQDRLLLHSEMTSDTSGRINNLL